MKLKFRSIIGLLLISPELFAQNQRMRSITQGMQQVNSDVMTTIGTIRGWVYGMISLFIIVKIIQILAGNDRGDDKIMKAGGLFAVLIIGAIIIYVAESVYG